MPDRPLSAQSKREWGVRCTTASNGDVLVTVDATDEHDAMAQVQRHKDLFRGNDAAGRWLAAGVPNLVVAVHEAKPIEEWD